MRIKVIHKEDDFSKTKANYISQRLTQLGFVFDTTNPELIITIGGDGTLLHAIHENYQHESAIYLGLHTGTLGFLTEYTCDDIEQFLQDIQKPFRVVEKSMLEAWCYKDDELRHHVKALNECRVENIIKTQLINVSLNGEFLESFRGNGLCVSGQIGSTAYNRSIGGAILDDKIEALQLSEISGIHHRFFRSLYSPLIMCSQTQILFESDNFDGAKLLYDHHNIDLHQTNKILIRTSNTKIKFAKTQNRSYYSRLHTLF